MARQTERLSPARVKHAKPGMHADGGGLYLQVTVGKDDQINKSWIFRFALAGKERQMGLGSLKTIGLRDARDEAERCRKMLREGKDPIVVRDAKEAEQQVANAKSMTFDRCAELFMKSHESGWRNAKHRQQWRNTLATYAAPIIGKLLVRDVDTELVMQVLQPIWTTKPETAGRVRGRIESILDWAKVSGYRDGENPARWRGHLDHLLVARSKVRKVRHHPALPHAQIGEFMAALRKQEGIAALALEFAILTAARSGEVRGMRWDDREINIADKVWTVPAERMKGDREHRVPLSPTAIEMIEQMREMRQNDFVFPGEKPDHPLSDMALTEVIRRMSDAAEAAGGSRWADPKNGDADVVPHGLRSTFRDWISEETNFPPELAEAALAHIKGDKTEAAYKRGTMFDKRRDLMDAWAAHCNQPADDAKVVRPQFGGRS
jgi:integrase